MMHNWVAVGQQFRQQETQRRLNRRTGAAKGARSVTARAAADDIICPGICLNLASGEAFSWPGNSNWSLTDRLCRSSFDNNVDQALRALKKKLQREGVYREMKLRRHYEKPSEKRARERAAAIRRARKLERKRAERESAR